jgi:hypothetical protein
MDHNDPNYLGYYVIDRQMGYQFILPAGWHPHIYHLGIDDDSVRLEAHHGYIGLYLYYDVTHNSFDERLDSCSNWGHSQSGSTTNAFDTHFVFCDWWWWDTGQWSLPSWRHYAIYFQPDPDSFLIKINIMVGGSTTFNSEEQEAICMIQDSIQLLGP